MTNTHTPQLSKEEANENPENLIEILIDVPEVLETERLTLKCPLPNDGPAYFDFVSECAIDLKQWFGAWAKEPFSAEQCEELVRNLRCEFMQRSELNYFWFRKGTDRIIGASYLLKLSWTVPKGMLAYFIRPSEQQKGFGFEAVEAMKNLSFDVLHFKRLELHIDPKNDASQKLAIKCGFELEGRLRNYREDNFGVVHDFLSYSMIPSEEIDAPAK